MMNRLGTEIYCKGLGHQPESLMNSL